MVVTQSWEDYTISEDLAAGLRAMLDLRHVAHRTDARRILIDGVIKTGLVYDESILRRHRIQIIWYSPNRWHDGPMYGTVSFESPIENVWTPGTQHFYWVEAVTHYTPVALRFLLSAKPQAELQPLGLRRIEPEQFDQPLFIREERAFWLPNYTYEIMVDHDMPLDLCNELVFEKHNNLYCNKVASKSAGDCSERDVHESRRQLISLALSTENPHLLRLVRERIRGLVAADYAKSMFTEWLLPNIGDSLGGEENRSLTLLHLSLLALGHGHEGDALQGLKEIGPFNLIKELIGDQIENRFPQLGRNHARLMFEGTAEEAIESHEERIRHEGREPLGLEQQAGAQAPDA
jgi:hypothetical protein